jgi:outer membrane protein assembly factor BamB/precorrin-6B methylase 2
MQTSVGNACFLWGMAFAILPNTTVTADDWPMLGRDASRNAVSPESDPPLDWNFGKYDRQTTSWDANDQRNVRWVARLGSMTMGDPVVVDGLVWVGTNNYDIHKQRVQAEDASVLACFRESDGQLLYRYVSPRLRNARWSDWPTSSMASAPLVEGDRLWFVSNRGEVICLDIGPLKRSEGQPNVKWKVDMITELGVFPRGSHMAMARLCSIASHGDRIYVNTGNGGEYGNVRAPDAPSLLCMDKGSGKILWQDDSPGGNLLNGQWASPLVADVAGLVQVIAAQGDGWVRSFDAITGELAWKFDMNRKASIWGEGGGEGDRNNLLATPVLYENRIYVGVGQHPADGDEGLGRLCCVDVTKRGDISMELAVDADGNPLRSQRRTQIVDPSLGEQATANPNSGLIWEFIEKDENGDGEIDWEEGFNRTISSVAIKDDLLIAVDMSGIVHCIDARSGKRHWYHDLLAKSSSTPLIVDEYVYVADQDGDVSVFRLSADPTLAMFDGEPINSKRNGSGSVPNVRSSIYASPVFANGTLYVASRSHLFAIGGEERKNQQWRQTLTGWPQWRGPNRDNKSNETGLLQKWPEEGPPLVWQIDGLGQGIASVSIVAGRIYTTTYSESTEFVVCLDQQSGELLWATPVGPSVPESSLMRWLSQRAPTVDGDRLYTVTASGELVCLSTQDGRELWRRDYALEFQGKRGSWGFCDFPLVDGDKLICTPGGSHSSMVALDKRSGKVIWSCPVTLGDTPARNAGYASAVVVDVDGVRQYVNHLHGALVGVDASNGQLLWKYTLFDKNQTALSPIVLGSQLFCSGGHGNYGVALLSLSQVNGQWSVTEEYYNKKVILNHFQDSTIQLGNHIFSSSRRGPICIDWRTGEVIWEAQPSNRTIAIGSRQFRGSRAFMAATGADHRLYFRNALDELLLVEPTAEEYRPVSSFVLPDPSRSVGATAPVIYDGHLLVRDDDRMFCYDVRRDNSASPPAATQKVRVELPRDPVSAGKRDKNVSSRSVFVPTPQDVLEEMLGLANVGQGDLVYDLGSGDGRIVIAAAKRYGCKAIGVEIDRELVDLSRTRAEQAGVEELVTIEFGDIFKADLSKADVVAVYLLPKQLKDLMGQFSKLPTGARIVSHQFKIPGIEPNQSVQVESDEAGAVHDLHLWIAPIQPGQQD